MASVTANLMALGMTPAHARIVQLVSSLGAVIVVWRCFRHSTGMLGAALVAVATFLTTPYAFGYDMPMLTAAVIVVASERWQQNQAFAFIEILVLLASFLLPFCALWPQVLQFSSLIILSLLCLIVHRNGAWHSAVGSRPPGQGEFVLAPQ